MVFWPKKWLYYQDKTIFKILNKTLNNLVFNKNYFQMNNKQFIDNKQKLINQKALNH